jgi:amino acid transporter
MSAHGSKEKYDDVESGSSPNVVHTTTDVGLGEGKLHTTLKGRHMQMIAIGGSIGAGLFVGAGSALNAGGPGWLVIDFMIIGFMLLLTVNALGEMACMHPDIRLCVTPLTRYSSIPCRWRFL